jgi:hypothetical protein
MVMTAISEALDERDNCDFRVAWICTWFVDRDGDACPQAIMRGRAVFCFPPFLFARQIAGEERSVNRLLVTGN